MDLNSTERLVDFAADVNLLKVPDDLSLPDERLLFLSDILTTAWHANELGQVSKGDKVAIWGAGPGLGFLLQYELLVQSPH